MRNKDVKHKWMSGDTRCGRLGADADATKNGKVTCGRCLMLLKFDAKRAAQAIKAKRARKVA